MPTNDFLTKINDNCTFCLDTSESLIHLFWSCHITSSFWKDIFHWLKNVHLISEDYTASISTALGLRPDTSSMNFYEANGMEVRNRLREMKPMYFRTEPEIVLR